MRILDPLWPKQAAHLIGSILTRHTCSFFSRTPPRPLRASTPTPRPPPPIFGGGGEKEGRGRPVTPPRSLRQGAGGLIKGGVWVDRAKRLWVDRRSGRGSLRVRLYPLSGAQGEAKRGALAFAAALGPDVPAVRLDDMFADGQPQATARARAGRVHLVKPFEHPMQLVHRDTHPTVADPELNPAIHQP